MKNSIRYRTALLATTAMVAAMAQSGFVVAANAQSVAANTNSAKAEVEEVVVTVQRATRSAVSIAGPELQKILPGIAPLKAIQTLPGVAFRTADPWGNNEQNETLYVHGFSLQQLGYNFDGVPLGDQQYGNYNGLSPSRALTSENTGRVVLSTGAGDLATPSTSNLGGTIETYSVDPTNERSGVIQQTFGSYETTRSFVRLNSGSFAGLDGTNKLWVSGLHHDAKAWDFNGHQKGDQVNAKFVHERAKSKLTAYFDWNDKVEPNEDSIVYGPNDKNPPYTRPFLYPDYDSALRYLGVNGAPPASDGNNFRNYHSAAQRQDFLAYVRHDYDFGDKLTMSNMVYFHNNTGRGIVAGPINQAGLPGLFAVYFPGQDLKSVFGGTGYAVRTTEYLIERGGVTSTVKWQLGDHKIQAGGWYERNHSAQNRNWYPFAASSTDLSPYDKPTNKAFQQYGHDGITEDAQFHLQDEWTIRPDLKLQAGFKSTLQWAFGKFPVNQRNLATNLNPTRYPTGGIDTTEPFLPQLGAVYDINGTDSAFVNVQQNVRQFSVYGAGGASAWSLGNQAAFDLFKANTKPESSWTYEAGLRTKREVNFGPLTGIEGQLSGYRVDFSNRLLNISPTPVLVSLVAGAAVLANVGSVEIQGADLAATLRFGPNFSLYNAFSYNTSKYQDNYTTGSTTVPTAGKTVPGNPSLMNKFIASFDYGPFSAQLSGDYMGKRYTTFTNDLYVPSNFLLGLQAEYRLESSPSQYLKDVRFRVNVTNLANSKGADSVVVGAASGTYNFYPIAPRMVFFNVSTSF